MEHAELLRLVTRRAPAGDNGMLSALLGGVVGSDDRGRSRRLENL